jgi:hypothetical protein
MLGRPSPWLRRAAWLGLLLTAVTWAGCDKGSLFGPLRARPPVSAPPGDATPQQALRRFEWSWNQKSLAVYRTIFTQDLTFVCSALDPFPAEPWTREDEMTFASHLFVGGSATEPAANSISLVLGQNFAVRADPRPGKNTRWHQLIRASFILTIIDPTRETQLTGFNDFYLVRGDSASVPADAIQLGFGADSTHWYVERWEDDTSAPPATRTMPVTTFSLCGLKALYR